MSKVDELRLKYSKVTTTTFNKFAEGDKTKTKKYLEFMLKTWLNKEGQIKSSTNLIELVNGFDDLLPYIKNKDIYHNDYNDINHFISTIDKAIDDKEEKTFNREDHAFVLDETEKYILLQPTTHRGSLKYGSNTKWCTASKNNPSTFKNYYNDGFLVYLIDKTNTIKPSYNKIAFYITKHHSPSQAYVQIFNCSDTEVDTEQIIKAGWDENLLTNLIIKFRLYFLSWRKNKLAKDSINKILSTIKMIDFELLKESFKIVENSKDSSYLSEAKETVDSFINKLNNFKI